MRTKYCLMAAMMCISALLTAQETYQDTKLTDNDPNGAVCYIGMSGILEAPGADISTISTNPTGIGLFWFRQVTVSGGLIIQQDEITTPPSNNVHTSISGNKIDASFDQIGLVYSVRTDRNGCMNFVFDYYKSRNFDQALTAANTLSHTPQNELSAMKYPFVNDYSWSGVDANYASPMAPIKDSNGKQTGMGYLDGTAYVFEQYRKGYIGECNFDLDSNFNNRVYLGLTSGLHNVNHRSNSYYTESLERNTAMGIWEDLRIDGTGVDIRAGAIFLPTENSPFHIGTYIHTPIMYSSHLKGTNGMTIGAEPDKVNKGQSSDYDFEVYAPWKFGLSLGHIMDRELALGAIYEYAGCDTINNRVNNSGYYGLVDSGYYDGSYSDDDMNGHTKAALKGVGAVKFDAEYKPHPSWAVHLRYNYLSPMFNRDGYHDGNISSPGSAYATSTDYTNWGSTNRITCGLGYSAKKFLVDLIYQYTQTNGDLYSFMSYRSKIDKQENCIADAVSVNNKYHQLLLTLGYRF